MSDGLPAVCVACGEPIDNSSLARYVPGYEMWVHSTCWGFNKNRWQFGEERVLKHMVDKGIRLPTRNSFGFLPRDYPFEEYGKH